MMGPHCAAHARQLAMKAEAHHQHAGQMQQTKSTDLSTMPCCDGEQTDMSCANCDCNPGGCSSAKVQLLLSLHVITTLFVRTDANVLSTESNLPSQNTPPLLRPPIAHFA